MKLSKRGGTLSIRLQGSCTIGRAVDDLNRLPGWFKEVQSVELKIGEIEDLDTAYFQLLLAVRAAAEVRNADLRLTGESKIFTEMCELYGIAFAERDLE